MLTARKRVLVVGCAGAGKSTLARRLGAITGLPVLHIDRHLWQPGWRQTLRPEWLVKLRGLLREPRWIMDGNFRSSLALRLAAADAVIHLDFPRRICLFRVLKRVAREYGRSRPDMANGCRERFDWAFLRWVWRYRRDVRPGMLRHLTDHGSRLDLVTLSSPRQTEGFLRSVAGAVPTRMPGLR